MRIEIHPTHPQARKVNQAVEVLRRGGVIVYPTGTVYGLGPRGHLFAVSLADGRELWSHVLDGETESRQPDYGYATAPLVVGDVVVVQTGGPGGRSITAFDRRAGRRRWSVEDDAVNYQSPALAELGGQTQLVALNNKYLLGLDPASGEVLWKHEHQTLPAEAFTERGVTQVDWQELLATSYAFSLHLPLNDSTRHLFDAAAFAGLARRALGETPMALYLHENQLLYPDAPGRSRDDSIALVNWKSMLAADAIW